MRLWSLEEEQRSRWWRWWWWWCWGTQLHNSRSFTTSAISCYKSHCVRDIEKTIGSSPSVALCGSFCFSICQLLLAKPFIMCRDKTQNKSSSIPPHNKAIYLHKVQENLNLLLPLDKGKRKGLQCFFQWRGDPCAKSLSPPMRFPSTSEMSLNERGSRCKVSNPSNKVSLYPTNAASIGMTWLKMN